MASEIAQDVIVLSIVRNRCRVGEDAKATNNDIHPLSDGILSTIAAIRQTLDDVLRLSDSLRKVSSERVDLAPTLLIQRVAFDNACKFLLFAAAKSRQDVDNMFEDPNHPIWTDLTAHRNLQRMMHRFYGLCLKALEQYRNVLNELRTALGSSVWKGKWQATRKWLSWRNKRSPQLNTMENLSKLVQNLENYNDLFNTLVRQAVPSRSGHVAGSLSAEGLVYSHPIRAVRTSYGHITCIQRASQILYNTLSRMWTCREREAHGVSISLKVSHAKDREMVPSRGICFNVAVTKPHFHGPYRVLVNSASGDFCTCEKAAESRVSDERHIRKTFESTTQASGAGASLCRARHGATRTAMRPELMLNSMRNLGLEEDLCLYLRNSCAKFESTKAVEDFCLGYLRMGNCLDCLFLYIPRGFHRSQQSLSLDDVLARANIECRALPVENRLRTASFLAFGVLQLHGSSWVPSVLSSKDIHFYGIDERVKERASAEPFLQVELDDSIPRHPITGMKSTNATCSSLLSLGLILCELAFSAPWRRLLLQEDITKDLCEQERNFLNLMRLSETVSRELGSRYANVVRICLWEGFAAQELDHSDKAELEKVILEDVVQELNECLLAVSDN